MKVLLRGVSASEERTADTIEGIGRRTSTMVFYESPHRLLKTLTQFAEYFGAERQVTVSREISKLHEETVRGSLAELIEHLPLPNRGARL